MWVSPYVFAHAIVGRKQEPAASDSDMCIRIPSGSEQFDGVEGQ